MGLRVLESKPSTHSFIRFRFRSAARRGKSSNSFFAVETEIAEDLGNFFVCQPGKISQLNQLGLNRMLEGKLVQRLIHCQQLILVRRRGCGEIKAHQLYALVLSAVTASNVFGALDRSKMRRIASAEARKKCKIHDACVNSMDDAVNAGSKQATSDSKPRDLLMLVTTELRRASRTKLARRAMETLKLRSLLRNSLASALVR